MARIASLKARLKAGWRSGSTDDDGDALYSELNALQAALAAQPPEPQEEKGAAP